MNVKKGYQACPKIHVKRGFFHNRALYVRSVNRVSNSCKIDLKGYDFLEILRASGSFVISFFLQLLCLKDPLNFPCLGL